LKPKDLVGIPWRVAFSLQAAGWYLRQDIIWHKPNPMPESVTDRCTKAHEYIFLMSKNGRYYYDNEAIKEDSIDQKNYKFHGSVKEDGTLPSGQKYEKRNKRSVWTITTKAFSEAHFATFPTDLITPMIKAGCPEMGVVLDPFMGAGTTAYTAKHLGRQFIGFELNPEYCKIINRRTAQKVLWECPDTAILTN
jgi:DNA modification methylase